jgi:hypothetical protein
MRRKVFMGITSVRGYCRALPSTPSSLLDRDHLHAEAVALADVIFDRPKPMLLQNRINPLAGEIVIILDLAPIGIGKGSG